jgi:apyrase
MPPRADCGTVWQRRPLAVLLLLFALSAATATAKAGPPPRYAIIIDAGSTGSRVHIFNVLSSGRGWPNVALPAAVKRTTPGLSTHVARPAGVTQSLQPLLQFAQQQVWSERSGH